MFSGKGEKGATYQDADGSDGSDGDKGQKGEKGQKGQDGLILMRLDKTKGQILVQLRQVQMVVMVQTVVMVQKIRKYR